MENNLMRLSTYNDVNGQKVYARIDTVEPTTNDSFKISKHYYTIATTNTETSETTFQQVSDYYILFYNNGKLVDKVRATSYYTVEDQDKETLVCFDKKTIITREEYLSLGGKE